MTTVYAYDASVTYDAPLLAENAPPPPDERGLPV
jgi:hypothetical protein